IVFILFPSHFKRNLIVHSAGPISSAVGAATTTRRTALALATARRAAILAVSVLLASEHVELPAECGHNDFGGVAFIAVLIFPGSRPEFTFHANQVAL